MQHVIAPLVIDTAPAPAPSDRRSPSAIRERRRDEQRFIEAHSSPGARLLYRLVCALSGAKA